MRLKKRKKRLELGTKEDPLALKAKKGNEIKSCSSSKDEQDNAEASLLVKGFMT